MATTTSVGKGRSLPDSEPATALRWRRAVGLALMVMASMLPSCDSREVGKKTPEEIARKYEETAAAFAPGARPEVDPSIDELLERYRQAVEERDGGDYIDCLDVDRMVLEAERTDLVVRMKSSQRSAMVRMIRVGLRASADDLMPWGIEELAVRRVTPLEDPDEVLIYIRCVDGDGILSRERWWLKRRDGVWRMFDQEDLELGLRMPTAIALGMAEAEEGRGAWPARAPELQIALEPADFGDLSAARRELEALEDAEFPALVESLRLAALARVACGQERYAEAIQVIDAAAEINNDMPVLDYFRANACNGLGRHVEALTAAQKYVITLGGDADAFVEVGDAYRGMGRAEEAMDAYRRGLEDYPDLLLNLVGLGQVLPQGGKDEVGDHFQRMSEPDASFLLLVESQLEVNDFESAEIVATRLLRLYPGHAAYQLYNAAVRRARGDLESAVSVLRRREGVITADESLVADYDDMLVRTLLRMGRYDEAVRAAKASTARDEDPFYEVIAHAAAGNVDETLSAMQTCVEEFYYSHYEFYDDEDAGPALLRPEFAAVRAKFPPP